MTIEERLKNLIIERYGSVRAFTLKIKMPYSTIDTIFKRGIGKAGIDNIIRICRELSISVDELSEGRIAYLYPQSMTADEASLLYSFRTLNARGKQAVMDHLQIVCGNPDLLASAPPSSEKKVT